MKANWSSSAENSVREKIHYKWNWLFSLVGNLIHWLIDWLFAAVLACKEWSVRGICNHWWQSCLSVSRCMCPAENPGCRDQPFTILYRVMDVLSGRSVPSDIFQMQATTRYPGAYYIFQIKSGNEGREFYMRQTGPISATLVMTRPVKGPRTVQLDLEMITVNTVINFRGSSVIRLRIFVSQYSF